MSAPDSISEGECPGGIVTHLIFDGEVIASVPVLTDADLINVRYLVADHPGCDVVSYDGDTGKRIDLGFIP
jgi:hypothetical protein